jgi:hypothetical protein
MREISRQRVVAFKDRAHDVGLTGTKLVKVEDIAQRALHPG